MLILAIDTATKIGSVALYDDKIGVVGEINLYVKLNHSNIIMSAVDNLFKMTNLKISDVDRVAVTIGPGSFTGIRIGVSIAKGLVYGTDKEIVGVNELDVIAANAESRDEVIVPLIDARKQRVYSSAYRFVDGNLDRERDYENGDLVELLKDLKGEKFVFIGDGATAYEDIIKEELGEKARVFSKVSSIPRAAVAAKIASSKEFDNLYTLEPYYVNKSQAEIEKEAREKK